MNYKIRASFLLFVFSTNTLAGFACSIGLDLNYNTNHHKHDIKIHEKIDALDSNPQHNHTDHSIHQPKHEKNEDDCCANEVKKFTQLDKSVANSFQFQVPFFSSIIPDFYSKSLLSEKSISVISNFQFVRRCCFLYDTEIRIAIQSFQI